jgi:hypothetical protein
MSDTPPFDPPYQKLSSEFAQAMLAHASGASKAPSASAPAKGAGQSGGAGKGDQFFLVVPFAEKDGAKALGARWDAAARKWYVPAGKDRDAFKQWWPAE